jgi:hypothetical protein
MGIASPAVAPTVLFHLGRVTQTSLPAFHPEGQCWRRGPRGALPALMTIIDAGNRTIAWRKPKVVLYLFHSPMHRRRGDARDMPHGGAETRESIFYFYSL